MKKLSTITIKRVRILSLAKVQTIMGVCVGLVVGVIFSIYYSLNQPAYTGITQVLFGDSSIIALPIVYGIIGFLSGLVGGFIYNLAAQTFHGVELKVERKNTR